MSSQPQGIWKPWQAKKCTGFGESRQSSQLDNVTGDWEQAVDYCLENRTACTGGNSKLDTPYYNTANGDKAVYDNNFGAWGIITRKKDPDCYPNWGNWTENKCIGFKKSKSFAKLENIIGDWKTALNFCLAGNECGKLPKHDKRPKPLAEDKGIEGAWGTVYNNNDDKCLPKWEPWQTKSCTGLGKSYQSSKLDKNTI